MNDPTAGGPSDSRQVGVPADSGQVGRPSDSGQAAAESARTPPDIASFVLRFAQDVWREAGGEPRVRWRGHIRHVQSDAETRFTDFADAVAFIQSELARLTLGSVAGDSAEHQARAMTDSLRLWERFTADYTDLMVKSMQQTLRQTQAYQRQVGENLTRTFSFWNPLLAAGSPAVPASNPADAPTDSPVEAQAPPAPDPDVIAALTALQRQIAELADQVARLELAIQQGGKGLKPPG